MKVLVSIYKCLEYFFDLFRSKESIEEREDFIIEGCGVSLILFFGLYMPFEFSFQTMTGEKSGMTIFSVWFLIFLVFFPVLSSIPSFVHRIKACKIYRPGLIVIALFVASIVFFTWSILQLRALSDIN